MMLVKEKSQCCGCTACKAVCPHDAIVMRQDVLGFPYPEIMED
jgi:MinD superfamily P-loop ATPase